MKLIGFEIKKLLINKTLYFFIGVCLLFNITLIALTSGEHTYVNYVGEVIKGAGSQVNPSFVEYLGTQPESKLRNRLIQSCENAEKIYDFFDATALSEWYSDYDEYYVGSSYLQKLLFEKYAKLADSVQTLNSDNADLSVYAADATNRVHEVIFTNVLKALMVEGFVLISLLTIHIMDMERQNATAAIIYCSYKGRTLVKDKIFAAGIISICGILILYGVTLLFLFSVWHLGGIWDTNVSSSFHYVTDVNLPFTKPFLTWISFTVKEYFAASLLLEMALFVIWWLISSCIGILSSQSAKGFLITASSLIAPYFLSVLFGKLQLGWLYCLNTFSISMLTINQHLWFTEMGINELLPWQEILSCVIHLLISIFLLIAATKAFMRKDLI